MRVEAPALRSSRLRARPAPRVQPPAPPIVACAPELQSAAPTPQRNALLHAERQERSRVLSGPHQTQLEASAVKLQRFSRGVCNCSEPDNVFELGIYGDSFAGVSSGCTSQIWRFRKYSISS